MTISENVPYAFPPDGDRARLGEYGIRLTAKRVKVSGGNFQQLDTGLTLRALSDDIAAVYLWDIERYRYTGRLWRQLARHHPQLFSRAYKHNGMNADFEINRFVRDLGRMRDEIDPEGKNRPDLFGEALNLYGSVRNMPSTNPWVTPGLQLEVPIMSLGECYRIAQQAAVLGYRFEQAEYSRLLNAWRYNLPVDVLFEVASGASIEVMQQFSRND